MAKFTYKSSSVGFTDKGTGDALVLLHGFTESRFMWDGFAAGLSDRFRVIAIDLPGHGESGSLGDVHTMEDMAGLVRAVLDHLGVSRCVIIGHSMGGYVALAFAGLFPSMVAGLGLFHSTAAADSDEARSSRDKAISVIRNDRKGFLFQFIPSLFSGESRERLRSLIDELVAEASSLKTKDIIAAQEGMKIRADQRDLIATAGFPVLFIIGKKDIRIPIDSILPQIALPRLCYSLILEDAGHMGWAEAPEATMRMISMFAEACCEH